MVNDISEEDLIQYIIKYIKNFIIIKCLSSMIDNVELVMHKKQETKKLEELLNGIVVNMGNIRCNAKCNDGSKCKRTVLNGKYCYQHLKN